jgi:hypothetical protein
MEAADADVEVRKEKPRDLPDKRPIIVWSLRECNTVKNRCSQIERENQRKNLFRSD